MLPTAVIEPPPPLAGEALPEGLPVPLRHPVRLLLVDTESSALKELLIVGTAESVRGAVRDGGGVTHAVAEAVTVRDAETEAHAVLLALLRSAVMVPPIEELGVAETEALPVAVPVPPPMGAEAVSEALPDTLPVEQALWDCIALPQLLTLAQLEADAKRGGEDVGLPPVAHGEALGVALPLSPRCGLPVGAEVVEDVAEGVARGVALPHKVGVRLAVPDEQVEVDGTTVALVRILGLLPPLGEALASVGVALAVPTAGPAAEGEKFAEALRMGDPVPNALGEPPMPSEGEVVGVPD